MLPRSAGQRERCGGRPFVLPRLLLGHLALIGAFASIEFLPPHEIDAAEVIGSPTGEYCRIAREGGGALVRSALDREAAPLVLPLADRSGPALAFPPAPPPFPTDNEHSDLLTRRIRAPGRGHAAR